MDLLAIAALEAFDGPQEGEDDNKTLIQQQQDVEADSSMVVAGVKRKAEEGASAEISADDIDPALSFEGPSHHQPPPQDVLPSSQHAPQPPRLSASLANILSGGASSTSTLAEQQQQHQHQHQHQQALPPLMSSPYRNSMPLASATASSPPGSASTSATTADMTMVYYGPPERLSEDSALIRCICPYDDDDGFTIQCESCFAWLHGLCVDISPETVPDIYTCPLCVSGGRIARHVEARAARLQQLRKEAEDGLRRQRIQSNVTNSSLGSSSNNLQLLSSDPAVPTSELDEEYELLAKARGLAYQQSFDHNYTPTAASYHQLPYSQQPPPPHRIAKPTQSPYYQREQLPVQQHTLGPSPFLHPPPPLPQSQASLPPHQQQHQHQLGPGQGPLLTATSTQQARRAGSVTSNASNAAASTAGASNARRPKSSSPGGANVPQPGNSSNAQQQARAPKKRSSHAPQPSLPSIPQNSVLDSPGLGLKDGAPSQESGLSVPPPPKKRRSASAKEKEKENSNVEVPPSVLAPTSGSIGTNASMPSQQQASISTLKEAMAQGSIQPVRKTRLAAASISITSEVSGPMAAPSVLTKAPGTSLASFPTQGTASTTTGGPPSGSRDAFLSDDEDSGVEDRFEPWQFEYTPVNSLRYSDRSVEQAVNELVEQFVEEERENLSGTLDGEERTGTSGNSRRASPFGSQYSRNSSVRPSLLGGANSYLPPGIAQASRMASPVPSSGSSTPAYSSTGVASALAPPCLPVILPEPPISPSEFSNKLSVKPLATSSMSLAPPACTPFSGPTCVPSLMNPYPRPTIHGVFTSAAFNTGSLITFMNGEVISGEQYRDDPINQWHDLGVMKCHTTGISQPWDLVLDQRRFADESRFIRNGCHPNVFVKPVLIRKARSNENTTAGGKKARSAARRKVDQQKAVQEGGEFELAFGLYALQDIAKREELVLPFDWADDHVVHSLHTLLFSPSLVFPTIPSNVESETEDDGIPSTSSFTHLTATQKGQIAQCTKHLYRLSRLASQTCLTLLGTSICACEKRRDCSIAWLWKLACFSESSSARSRGTIQLQDFDLNGLRAACSSALATDDKDWVATPGANGRMSNKKSSRKRRADLGALIGLARGWERPPVEPVSAIPPRLASEEAIESEEETELPEEDKMQVDEPEQLQETHTPTVERPNLDFGNAIQEDVVIASVPTSAEVDKADTPFQFAPPVAVEESTLQSSAHIREEEESKTSFKALAAPEKEVPEVSPMSTRPNTAQSTGSDRKQSASKPAPAAQDDDSDSDITEPLPSDHSDNDEPIKKPSMRKSPVKEMTKKLTLEKQKNIDETSKASRASPTKSDDMQVDDEEVVRPPKKKKALLRKQESEKPSKAKSSQKTKKVDEEEEKTPAKKALKDKGMLKRPKSGDPATPRERPSFGGLPSFRTKKQIDQAKEIAALKEKEEGKKPAENPPVAVSAAPAVTTVLAAAITPAPPPNAQLDGLFDMPLPPAIPQPKVSTVESAGPSSDASKTPQVLSSALPSEKQQSMEAGPASDAMQVDLKPQPTAEAGPAQAEVSQVNATLPVVEEKTAAMTVTEDKPHVPAAAPAVRRVSFQAYKMRVSIVPSASSTTQDVIPEDVVATSSPATERAVSIPVSTPTLSIKPELPSEAVLGGEIVQTPIMEKTASQANEGMSKPQVEPQASPAIEASPAPAQSPLQAAAAMPPTAAKPRLSFAAYRQRATTAPKPLPMAASPATVPVPLASAAAAALPSVAPISQPVDAAPAQTVTQSPKTAMPTQQPVKDKDESASAAQAKLADVEMKKEEEEQEEGELVVDPNLEPGEVETEPAHTKETPQTALGMRMGEFQQPDVPKKSNIKQSYTPPSRHRSLTPPKPVIPRQAEDKSSMDDSHQARPSTSHNASGKQIFAEASTNATNTTSSNANWAPLGRDRPLSPVNTFERGLSESSRYSASGASPPSHPRGFSRVSPRNSFQQPLPGSKPPTGPRSIPAPWPTRVRANSSSGPPGPGPAGRGGPPAVNGSDAIYGGGFGTAGSGGSSYRPTSSGGGGGSGRGGDGHSLSPPSRVSQPPSGPRALQNGPGFAPPSRGRGRHDGPPPGPPRDRGWGGRGGRGRGGGRERGGYY